MSKLRTRIRETALRRRGGLGFAPTATDHASSYVLVLAAVTDAAGASAAVESGAHALLYAGASDGVGAIVEAAGDIPVGCRLDTATADEANAIADAGADFLVFDDARTAADTLLERRLGYVLLLTGDANEERLRTIAPLNLDAILIGTPAETPTVADQLRLRRIAELARAPLIIPVAAAVPASTLEVWRDSGAPSVLVPADGVTSLPTLVAASREVRPPREHSEERPDPLVPSAAPTTLDEEPDEPFEPGQERA